MYRQTEIRYDTQASHVVRSSVLEQLAQANPARLYARSATMFDQLPGDVPTTYIHPDLDLDNSQPIAYQMNKKDKTKGSKRHTAQEARRQRKQKENQDRQDRRRGNQ